MKKLILAVTLSAFALGSVLQAGEACCASKAKETTATTGAACSATAQKAKAASACPASAKLQQASNTGCCAGKSATKTKLVKKAQSPKGAELAKN